MSCFSTEGFCVNDNYQAEPIRIYSCSQSDTSSDFCKKILRFLTHSWRIWSCCFSKIGRPGNPYWLGRISTIDLLELTISDQLLHIPKIFLLVSYKRCLSWLGGQLYWVFPFQWGFPGKTEPKVGNAFHWTTTKNWF